MPQARDVRLHGRLLAWYDRVKRDLPWRRTRDPWAILVSEVMLQQTRVETVIPYYARWMDCFPTPAALAAASEEEVMRLWAGLGYYSRARNLHRAAGRMVADHRGNVPGTFDALRELPGVGDYTAGAVASIAFGEAVPAMDGNVLRVLARLDAHRGNVKDAKVRKRRMQRAAGLVPAERAGDWTQALMELGAMVCTPRNPRCGDCPLAAGCVARCRGLQHKLPVASPKRPPRREVVDLALIERKGRVLLVPGPRKGLLAGLWRLPGGSGGLPALVWQQTGLRLGARRRAATAEHRFTHRHWTMRVWRCDATGRPGTGVRWLEPGSLGSVGLSSAHRKALRAAGYGNDP